MILWAMIRDQLNPSGFPNQVTVQLHFFHLDIKMRFNSGDDRIEYIVETSSDLRTWSSSGVTLDSC